MRILMLTALLLVVALVMSYSAQAAPGVCDYEGCAWLATGVLTKIDGQTFYLLGKDNNIYKVDVAGAELIFDSFTPGTTAVKVGETARVYGTVAGDKHITATRIRICNAEPAASRGAGPAKEIKIIMEKPTAPEPEQPAVQPPEPTCGSAWTGRGLITDIDYSGHKLKVRTASGQYSVNTGKAQFINGSKGITFGMFNQGDAVSVSGTLVGFNEVDAQQVSVTRTRSDAENALPQLPLSVMGVIQNIDYPSLTFKMWTETTPIVVSADKDTIVQEHMYRMAFMDLKPGMRIKMSGYGSLATGYVAQHIMIISVSP